MRWKRSEKMVKALGGNHLRRISKNCVIRFKCWKIDYDEQFEIP